MLITVLDNFFKRTWTTIEGTRQWGADKNGISFPKLKSKSKQLGAATNPSEEARLDQFVQAAFGKGSKASESERKLAKAVTSYQFLTKIGFSALGATRNMMDRFNKAAELGPLSVMFKTLKQHPPIINQWMKSARELEDELVRKGAIFSHTAIGEGHEPGHVITNLAAKMFTQTERGTQTFIALAKKNAIEHNLKLLQQNPKTAKMLDRRIGKLLSPLEAVGRSPEQARNRLRDLGNDELINKLTKVEDISPELLDAVLHRTVRDRAFPIELSTKREWWDNKPLFRIPMQFKTWGIEQVGHVWNDVVKDTIKNRDPSKMVRWLVTMAVTGEIVAIAQVYT